MSGNQTSSATGQESASSANLQGSAIPQAGKFGPTTVNPQAGNSEATPPASSENTSTQADMSREEALEALRKERLEAARYRRKAQEYDELRQAEADAKLSESERLQKQLAEAHAARDAALAQAQERIVRSEVRSTAIALGIKPELALKLIDSTAIAFNSEGDPTNIGELITGAITAFGLTSLLPSLPGASAAPAQAATVAGQPAAQAAAQAPQTGATNPPRSGQIAGSNGVFAANEIPSLTDKRLWKR